MGHDQGEHPAQFPGYGEHRYGEIGEGIVDAFWTVLDSLSEPLLQDEGDQDTQIRNAMWAVAEMDLLVCLSATGRAGLG